MDSSVDEFTSQELHLSIAFSQHAALGYEFFVVTGDRVCVILSAARFMRSAMSLEQFRFEGGSPC